MSGTSNTIPCKSAPGVLSGRLPQALLLAGVSGLATLIGATSAHAAALPETRFTPPAFGWQAAMRQTAAPAPADVSPEPASGSAVEAFEQAVIGKPLRIAIRSEAKPVEPVLAVGLVESESTVVRGEPATFIGYANYSSFIERSEARIFEAGIGPDGEPHAVIAADRDGIVHWTPDLEAGSSLLYTFRVYDGEGRFDETHPQPIEVVGRRGSGAEPATRPLFGTRDEAARRAISLSDAAVFTIAGSGGAGQSAVRIAGQMVPVEADGRFVSEQIMPRDVSQVPVGLGQDKGVRFTAVRGAGTDADSWSIVANAPAAPGSDGPGLTAASDGMVISLDPSEDAAGAEPIKVEVRTDTTHVDPVLAVGLAESERTVVSGAGATFVAYSNYPAYIARGEVRIFRQGQSPESEPLQVVAADKHGIVRWTPGGELEGELFYTYRVYDRDGAFDETGPQELLVVAEPLTEAKPAVRPLFGTRDEAARRNIAFKRSATVTVTGDGANGEALARVGGQMVPVAEDGRFVSQQIVPQDTRQIWVTIGEGEEARFTAVRDVAAKRSDWFVVGQGDLTFVSSKGKGPAVDVSGSALADGDHVTSRAAFYAKGSLPSGVRITSSIDTGETLLKDLFSNLDRKDPRQLLRRMDSNQYYSTYGDDSTLVEDAPTQGRFYLKVEKDKSSLLVGNFVADIQQAELAQLNRGVFGAIVDHKSLTTTSFGESRLQVTAFASDPGTIPGRDEFRGTGGSLYFLKRRDLTVGSERLSVEVRDRDTGLVVSRRDLAPQEDYDIDYFQGRVTLLRPLSSTAADGDLVRQETGAGNVPVLVARYEYTPTVGDLTGYTLGGRGQTWLGDVVRLGVTGQRETTDSANQTLLGADLVVRAHAGTYVKAELAQSEGPGFGQSNSVDGGLSFTDRLAPGRVGDKARAWRGEIAVDLAELRGVTGDRGKASAFYEHFDAGFSANSQLTANRTVRWGASLDAPLGSRTTLVAKFERLDTETIGRRSVATSQLAHKLTPQVTISAGMRHDEQAAGLPGNSTEAGQRTDGVLQVAYAPQGRPWSLHAFGQATVDRDLTRRRNNRAGLGGKLELSDRLTAASEVSYGDGGVGANVEFSRRYGNGSENYLGYALVTDRTDQGLESTGGLGLTNRGTLTIGTRHRFSSTLGVHGENKIGHGGEAPSVMRSFGLTWDPGPKLSVSGSFETGHVDNEDTGRFRRTAATIGVGYTTEQLRLATNVEARFESGANREQTVWLFRNTASINLDPDWRALGRLNFAIADNETADERAANFVEGSVGFAYRPVAHDRLNVLARYTFLKDMGPIGQVTEGGETGSPKQKSQIVAIDVNYDLTKTLTLGGKYALRASSVSLGRESDVYVSSNTHLAVLRTDWRLVKRWDVVVEGHYLTNDVGGDSRFGGLAAVYRHMGDHMKIGVGYSFSDFSSDLADQSYTSKGVFVNLLGKF